MHIRSEAIKIMGSDERRIQSITAGRMNLRALPHWLAKQYRKLCRIRVLYSSQGSFGRQVAGGNGISSRDWPAVIEYYSSAGGMAKKLCCLPSDISRKFIGTL